jgi:pilus assembly protein CpaF
VEEHLQAIKDDILNKLTAREEEFRVNFAQDDQAQFQRSVETAFRSVVRENRISLKRHEQDEILSEIVAYFIGFGPIESLLKDDEVSEIMVNGPFQIYAERKGKLELTGLTFKNEEQVLYFIDMILYPLGRRLSEYEPFVDARLKDGSRVNIVRSPISRIGPLLTIRKFSRTFIGIEDLIKLGSFSSQVAEFLKACIISKINILISGGSGTT